jgi:predicted acyl esterase
MQLYLDEGYAYVATDTPGMGRCEGVWDPFRAPRARRFTT